MARRDFRAPTQLRSDTDQEARREALLVPWGRLQDAAEAYVESHTFVLWVRAVTETTQDVPELVRSALDLYFSGLARSDRFDTESPDWRALEEWIAAHRFADARRGGWFNALRYYAQNDLRTEQAWTHWEQTIADWGRHRPTLWPTFAEWKAAVATTHTLSHPAGQEHAVAGMARVEPSRLREAVSELLESRACAIWVDCVSRLEHHLSESVMNELRQRFPGLFSASHPAPKWGLAVFLRLVRLGGADWRKIAREEGWISALRYQVRHHPRYHRLIHYRERCRDVWSQSRPVSFPSFAEWLAAADAYYIRPPAAA
jgi:hypothetical protein